MALAVENKLPGAQDFEKQKNMLAMKVLSVKDQHTILLLTSYFQDITTTKRITKAQYNKEIDEAVKRVKAGKFTPNEEVMKAMKTW